MKKFKNIVLFPGHYCPVEPGQKSQGLDMGRFVRDILRQCGYDCVNCNEPDCFPKNPYSPILALENKIKKLEARLAALEN